MRIMRWAALVLLAYAQLASAQITALGSSRREALHHYREGQEHLSGEQYERAVAAFQQAIQLDDLFTDAHYGLGQAFVGLRRYASAAQAFRRCLTAAQALHALRERDRVQSDHRIDEEIRELREAVRQVERAVPLGQGRDLRILKLEQRIQDLQRARSSIGKPFEAPATVLLALGSVHFRIDEPTLAEHYWTEAVKVNPKFGEAWNNLAVVYMTTGRKKAAEDAVKNAERAGFRVNPRLKDDIKAMKG